jgi:hypothetical protein
VFGVALLAIDPPPDGDEPHYVIKAISIAQDHDRDLADEYDDPWLMQQVYGATSLEPHAFRFPGGHGLQSVHGPGLPLLMAPVAAVTHDSFWMRAELVVIAAIGAALLMLLLERVPFGVGWQRWAAWAAVVLSAPIVIYASRLYPEIPAATVVLGCALLLTRPAPGPGSLAAAGTLAATLPWLNVRFLALTIAIGTIAVWRAWAWPRR